MPRAKDLAKAPEALANPIPSGPDELPQEAPKPEEAPDRAPRRTELGPRPHPSVFGGSGNGQPVMPEGDPRPLSVENAMHKAIEPGWVPPEMRGNLDYQQKAQAQREQDTKDLAAARPFRPINNQVQTIGASPNMPAPKTHVTF